MGSLFGNSPGDDPSLFNGVMAQTRPSPALAALAASRGTQAPMPADSSVFAGPGSAAPAAPPPAAPQAPQQAASPAMPSPDDIQRRAAYAQELGVTLPGKHKFNWGHAALAFFGGTRVAEALMAGDYGTAATLNARGQMVARRGRDSQAEQLHQLAVYSALRDKGLPKDDAIIAMTNLDKLGENFNSRFRTDNIAEGQTRYQPNLNGTASAFTAPKLVQHGADYQFVTPPDTINSSAGEPPLDGNSAAMQNAIGSGPPAIPRLPAAPSQTATLGPSGRQISLPGADDGEADALVRQGVNAGASVDQITGALKSRYGYSDAALSRLSQSLAPAMQWKQRNPGAPFTGEVSVGAPPDAAPVAASRPGLPRMPLGAPMMGAAPLANVVGAGSLRTDAEQYADTLYPRGTREWRGAVQDAMLKANGPTAFGQDQQLQGQRLSVQMRGQDIDQGNNIRTNDTSAANNTRSTNASMSNNRNRPAAVGVDPQGNSVIIYPDNRVVDTHGIRPISSAARRGRQGGGAGGSSEGAVAVGPNGHKIVVRGGRWVDPVTGQPVG